MPQRLKTDWILFAAVLAMVLFGLLIVYSASSIMARLDARYNSSWYFVIRQAGYAVVAVVVMMALKRTHYRKFQDPAVAFSAIGVALMLLFAVYFVDAAHHRWLRLGGPVGVQPSELAKPALVIFLAFFVTWRARAINDAKHTLVPAALAVGFLIFAVVVPDLGTAVVLGMAAIWAWWFRFSPSLTGWGAWSVSSIPVSNTSPASTRTAG
jgi:cell division protein FtsW